MTLLLRRRAGVDEDGARIDMAVSAWLAEPRAQTQRRLAAGEVSVDGEPVAKSHRLQAGQEVVVDEAAPQPPGPPPPPVDIRYDDEHLLVVAKPADLVVHAGAGTRGGTLVDALSAMGIPLAPAGGADRPGIVHRLDRGTSGLLVVAKTDQAHAGLTDMLRRRAVEREYWALVDGVPASPHATVDAPIGRHPVHRVRFHVDPSGRGAVTHYDVVEALGRGSRLRVRLETGRTHQVRVHMAAVGHPVCGDVLYGARRAVASDLGLQRPALHARRLAFDHPVTGARVEVEEPPPGDLMAALDRLRELGAAAG